jgi:hypothetical protein
MPGTSGEEVRMHRFLLGTAVVLGGALALSVPARAETPLDIQRSLESAARQATPGFSGFSAPRGEEFFKKRHGREWSCASCHTADPRQTGTHAATGKSVTPLAPSANAERFTDPAKVDKWFRRNCNDVLGRVCTPLEKGDVLAWLLSLGR